MKAILESKEPKLNVIWINYAAIRHKDAFSDQKIQKDKQYMITTQCLATVLAEKEAAISAETKASWSVNIKRII